MVSHVMATIVIDPLYTNWAIRRTERLIHHTMRLLITILVREELFVE